MTDIIKAKFTKTLIDYGLISQYKSLLTKNNKLERKSSLRNVEPKIRNKNKIRFNLESEEYTQFHFEPTIILEDEDEALQLKEEGIVQIQEKKNKGNQIHY